MLKVLKISLKNSHANLAQAFLTGFVQCGLCLLLGNLVRMFAELLDGVKNAPVGPVLPLALSRRLLVQGVDQEVVSPQDEHEPCDPQNHEQIGRASCRERGSISAGGGALRKKSRRSVAAYHAKSHQSSSRRTTPCR